MPFIRLRPGRFGAAGVLSALAAALITASCVFFTQDDRTAHGGGSDTETLTGLVSTPAGAPAAGALVKLIPADYDPSHPDTARLRRMIADSAGKFRFDSLDKAQAYNLIAGGAGNAGEKTWAFAGGLRAGPGSKPLALSLAKVFLFALHSDSYNVLDSGIAYFPGTDILAHCEGVKASEVDSVPMGVLRFVVESRAGWAHDTTLVSAPDTAKVAADKSGVTVSP